MTIWTTRRKKAALLFVIINILTWIVAINAGKNGFILSSYLMLSNVGYAYFKKCPLEVICAKGNKFKIFKRSYGKKYLKALLFYGGFVAYFIFNFIYILSA